MLNFNSYYLLKLKFHLSQNRYFLGNFAGTILNFQVLWEVTQLVPQFLPLMCFSKWLFRSVPV